MGWISRRWLREADVRNERTIFFLIDRVLVSAPPSGTAVLTVRMPEEDWAWLCERPSYRVEMEQGLENYLKMMLRRHGVPLEANIELGVGTKWSCSWKAIGSPEKKSSGFLVFPDPRGARWVPWPYEIWPRTPNEDEQHAHPEQLDLVLQELGSKSGRRWQPLEKHTLCGRESVFIAGGENNE